MYIADISGIEEWGMDIGVLQFIMKNTAYILLLISLFGCKSDNHIGSWIESDNLVEPIIVGIYTDSICFENMFASYKSNLYKLKGDTLLLNGFYGITRLLLKCSGDSLSISTLGKDSSPIKYERNIYTNLLDFFNKKLNTDVEVPKIGNTKEISFHNSCVFLLDYDKNQELRIHYNGRIYKIDSSSYLKLFPDDENLFDKNLIIADKDVIYKDIKYVKSELGKGRRYNIEYLTLEDSNKICGLSAKAKVYRGKYPDSLGIESFPPLPKINLNNFNENKSLIGYYTSKIEYNGLTVSEAGLKDSLIDNINEIDNFVCFAYFEEELTYELYLKKLKDLYDIYGYVRNEYSKDKYSKGYSELDDSTRRVVKMKIKRRISEIGSDKYAETITNYNRRPPIGY